MDLFTVEWTQQYQCIWCRQRAGLLFIMGMSVIAYPPWMIDWFRDCILAWSSSLGSSAMSTSKLRIYVKNARHQASSKSRKPASCSSTFDFKEFRSRWCFSVDCRDFTLPSGSSTFNCRDFISSSCFSNFECRDFISALKDAISSNNLLTPVSVACFSTPFITGVYVECPTIDFALFRFPRRTSPDHFCSFVDNDFYFLLFLWTCLSETRLEKVTVSTIAHLEWRILLVFRLGVC